MFALWHRTVGPVPRGWSFKSRCVPSFEREFDRTNESVSKMVKSQEGRLSALGVSVPGVVLPEERMRMAYDGWVRNHVGAITEDQVLQWRKQWSLKCLVCIPVDKQNEEGILL